MESTQRKRKMSSDQERDPEYVARRERNNESVKRSREKAKLAAEERNEQIRKLREANKYKQGEISQQKQTKKILKELFRQQIVRSKQNLTKEQKDVLNEPSDHDSDSDTDKELKDEISACSFNQKAV